MPVRSLRIGWIDDVVSVLVLPDIHVPVHDAKSIDAICDYASLHHWDFCLQLGDFLDMESLSRFSRNDAASLVNNDVAEEFAKGREVIAQLKAATRRVNSDCKFLLIEGNHEARAHKFCTEMPQLRTLLSVPENLQLENDDWWIRADSAGHILRFDYGRDGLHLRIYSEEDRIHESGVAFIHGWYTNQNHAKKTVERFGHGPIFYGHTHDVMTAALYQYGPDTPEGGSLGHLAKPQRYLHGRPTNWQQAFGVFHLTSHGYTRSIVRINDNKFVGPDGRLYGNCGKIESVTKRAVEPSTVSARRKLVRWRR